MVRAEVEEEEPDLRCAVVVVIVTPPECELLEEPCLACSLAPFDVEAELPCPGVVVVVPEPAILWQPSTPEELSLACSLSYSPGGTVGVVAVVVELEGSSKSRTSSLSDLLFW